MNKVEKKLKRGLEDISPLFRNAPSSSSSPTEILSPCAFKFDVQFLTVCVPDHEGDAFLSNAYLASQVIRQSSLFSSLVSIIPGAENVFPSVEHLDSRISRLRLSPEELWALTQNGRNHLSGEGVRPSEPQNPFLVFLEFEPSQFRSLSRVALLLDRVILFVPSQVESLREAYRLMKIFWNLNREIEFLLLFRDKVLSLKRQEYLFEQFSLIASRFLGISPGWLGNLAFPGKNDSLGTAEEVSEFNPEYLLAADGLRRPLSPEKLHLWNKLRKILR